MRVDELIVASSGQVLRIGFHDRMTVLSGFDAAEREGLTETLQRAAVGAVPEPSSPTSTSSVAGS